MSKNNPNTNISVAIAIALMLITAVLVSSCSMKGPLTDEEIIESVSDQIAGYTIPDGYREEFAVDMLGYQVVNLQGPEPSCHIYIVQSSEDTSVSLEELEEKAASAQVGVENGRYSDLELVEQRTGTILGQEVTLLVSEGTNSDDQPYRQVNAAFEGRNGPALISISAPDTRWDWDLVNSFLSSIN